jgi:hypothetical protein
MNKNVVNVKETSRYISKSTYAKNKVLNRSLRPQSHIALWGPPP